MSPCFSSEWHEIDMIGDQTTLFFHVLIFVISPFLLTVSKSLFKKQQCFNKFPCFTKFLPEKARNWQKGWTELCEVGKLSSVEIQKTKTCFWQKINLKFPCVFLFSLCFFFYLEFANLTCTPLSGDCRMAISSSFAFSQHYSHPPHYLRSTEFLYWRLWVRFRMGCLGRYCYSPTHPTNLYSHFPRRSSSPPLHRPYSCRLPFRPLSCLSQSPWGICWWRETTSWGSSGRLHTQVAHPTAPSLTSHCATPSWSCCPVAPLQTPTLLPLHKRYPSPHVARWCAGTTPTCGQP